MGKYSLIRLCTYNIGTLKPWIKVCKSMQKHAKAPLNFVFRDYSLNTILDKLCRESKTFNKSVQKRAKACKSMQKHHKTSIFVTTHLIPFWANYIANPKLLTKACKSMQKHAKAPSNFNFRDYPLLYHFGKIIKGLQNRE